MKTVSINLYSFEELSEQAQQNAIDKNRDFNIDRDWWKFTYEDAERIGLKITSFDLDRNRHADGNFLLSPQEVAANILKEHGEECETYKTASKYLEEQNPIFAEYTTEPDNMEELENKLMELEEQFLNDILEDYSIMLQNEYEYLISDEAIKEILIINEYLYFKSGEMAHVTQYTGKHERAGETEVKIHGETILI